MRQKIQPYARSCSPPSMQNNPLRAYASLPNNDPGARRAVRAQRGGLTPKAQKIRHVEGLRATPNVSVSHLAHGVLPPLRVHDCGAASGQLPKHRPLSPHGHIWCLQNEELFKHGVVVRRPGQVAPLCHHLPMANDGDVHLRCMQRLVLAPVERLARRITAVRPLNRKSLRSTPRCALHFRQLPLQSLAEGRFVRGVTLKACAQGGHQDHREKGLELFELLRTPGPPPVGEVGVQLASVRFHETSARHIGGQRDVIELERRRPHGRALREVRHWGDLPASGQGLSAVRRRRFILAGRREHAISRFHGPREKGGAHESQPDPTRLEPVGESSARVDRLPPRAICEHRVAVQVVDTHDGPASAPPTCVQVGAADFHLAVARTAFGARQHAKGPI
mmetsp:Transcript_89374/g.251688  ORF Transcript_89374/g.251688 Transcript_89374/m.251688 type:complete len:392 (-) Transcript_89374:391-1566(-)